MTQQPRCLISSTSSPKVRVGPGDVLTIGRAADMIISNDPFLHRQCLVVEGTDTGFFVTNIGTSLRVTLVDDPSRSVSKVEPGGRHVLMEGRTSAAIETSERTHEILFEVSGSTSESGSVVQVPHGSRTARPRPLTPDQILLLTALAEPMLRDPTKSVESIPSNAEVAERLGIGAGFNGRLDRLCAAVARRGVEGLDALPSDDPLAFPTGPRKQSRRRERLVLWAISAKVVTEENLGALEEAYRRVARSQP